MYSFAGALAIVAFTPILLFITRLESVLQTKHMKKKDQRIEMVTEVLNNVKVSPRIERMEEERFMTKSGIFFSQFSIAFLIGPFHD